MQEDWEGFDFWRKNFLKKKKKLIFSIFFSIFFSAPPAVGFILLCKSALIFSALVTSPIIRPKIGKNLTNIKAENISSGY